MSFEQVYDIDLDAIEISKLNVREANATADLEELAASIRKHGLLQPVILRGEYGTPPYELIAGQRRYLAHERLGAKTIRSVFGGTLDDTQTILFSLIENLQSVDLNHADSARAVTHLYERFGTDERKVQRETGLSIQTIRDYLTIDSQASPKMKKLLKRGTVTKADVKRAIRAAQGRIQTAERLLDLMSEQPLTKHQKKRIVEYGAKHQKASAETILADARRPRVEKSIMVSLPTSVRDGLQKATEEFNQEAEETVMDVLQEWLHEQGFIDE